MSFIFGGNTGMTLEQATRQREIARKMAMGGSAPRNVGEGINAIGSAIAGVMLDRSAKKGQAAARDDASNAMAALFGGDAGGMGGDATAPAPDMGGAAPGSVEMFDPSAQPADSLTARQIMAESGGDPNAVSPKGATGLMQVMPATARDPGYGVPNIFEVARQLGRDVQGEDPVTLQNLLRDPEVNTAFGTAYRDAMIAQNGGDARLGLAAYNAGPGAVAKAGGVPNFPETQAYVDKLAPAGGAPVGPQGAQPQGMPQPGVGMAMNAGQSPQGQPQAQPAGGMSPRIQQIAQALANPNLNDQQRMIAQTLLQQEMQRSAPQSPQDALKMRLLQAQVSQAENPKPPATPSVVQEYEYARQNGFGGSYTEFLAAKKSGVNVTVNGGQPVDPAAAAKADADAAGWKESSKAFSQSMVKMYDGGSAAAENLAQVDQLEGLLAKSGTGTGAAWAQWATENLGIQVTGGPAQAASAIINKMIPSQRPAGSGSSSDRDVAMFRASLPQLVNTPEGNAEIIAGMRAISEYRYELAQIAGDHVARRIENPEAIDQMRAADAKLKATLAARREAAPDMYGKPFDPTAARRELKGLGIE
jgi:hypothetical protein